MTAKIRRHKELCDYIHNLYVRKNHDYGDSFHETFIQEGMAMPRIRIGDKFSRFKTLTSKVHNEDKSAKHLEYIMQEVERLSVDIYQLNTLEDVMDRIDIFKESLSPEEIGMEQKVTDESIRDTLLDMANYAIMTVLELDALNMRTSGGEGGSGGKPVQYTTTSYITPSQD